MSDDNNSNNNISFFSKVANFNIPAFISEPVLFTCVPILVWVFVFLLFGRDSVLPKDGSMFPLFLIVFGGILAGYIISITKLPPLLGMLTLGIVLQNVPYIDVGKHLPDDISAPLRQLALVVILIRAGLGLDPVALMRLKMVVFRLAFTPCLVEATTVAIVSYLILDFPWTWGFLLGFVLAAVSPAVIVPCLLSLKERGFGVNKGIPTIVIAAASVDDILAISLFGLMLGLTFSSGNSLVESIFQGPIEVLLGIGFGILWGGFLGIFLGSSDTNSEKESPSNGKNALLRVFFVLFGGSISVFGFQYLGYPGSGALGCLASTFIAAIFWRSKGVLQDDDSLCWSFSVLWYFLQPMLFGLIGNEIKLDTLDGRTVGFGIICLAVGLTIRIGVTYLVVSHAGLNTKERIFVAFAWLPKATVQAAIGPVALDTARQLNSGGESEKFGLAVLTIAVLSILITAPIGATFIMLGGPKLLAGTTNTDVENELDHVNREKSNAGITSGIENPVVLNFENGDNPVSKED